jgi:hypothetical protein
LSPRRSAASPPPSPQPWPLAAADAAGPRARDPPSTRFTHARDRAATFAASPPDPNAAPYARRPNPNRPNPSRRRACTRNLAGPGNSAAARRRKRRSYLAADGGGSRRRLLRLVLLAPDPDPFRARRSRRRRQEREQAEWRPVPSRAAATEPAPCVKQRSPACLF